MTVIHEQRNQRTVLQQAELEIKQRLFLQCLKDANTNVNQERTRLFPNEMELYQLEKDIIENLNQISKRSNDELFNTTSFLTTLIHLCNQIQNVLTPLGPNFSSEESKNNLSLLAIYATRLSQYPSPELREISEKLMSFIISVAENNGFLAVSTPTQFNGRPLEKLLEKFLLEISPKRLFIASYIKQSGKIVERSASILTNLNTKEISNISYESNITFQ